MLKKEEQLNILDMMMTDGAQKGLGHLTIDDHPIDGRIIYLNDEPIINFASCSYLGMETDPRLKQAAINAINRFGTQFSSSRIYLSVAPYAELEELLSQIFKADIVITPTTSLGHISALPVIVESHDAVIYDQQVHTSVQTAMRILQAQGIYTEILRHNRIDLLPERIESLGKKYKKIWYLADGVYSMYGDLAPMDELKILLDKYEKFYLYIDDAHGMGWTGKHGRGKVLSQIDKIHPHMVIATSLNKSFASAGGALIFPNSELKRKVKNCGGPMLFSGPIQPPMLGAAIASAKIHLSNEILILQEELKKRQQYCNTLLSEYELPAVSFSDAPIRFVGMGLPKVAQNMTNRLIKDGFYPNIALFPAVPMRRAGVRFTITNHQSMDDIKNLIQAMAEHLPKVLKEENTSLEEIEKAFQIKIKNNKTLVKEDKKNVIEVTSTTFTNKRLSLQHETTIEKIEQTEWNKLLGANGSFTWEGLDFLEKTFCDNPEPENNWNFHYYIIRDSDGIPILATFFTEALWKDDMLAPKEVSEIVEEKRKNNPYFLTSRVLSMGSLLTEGQHLYLNKEKDWQKAMNMLLNAILKEQERCGASILALRDFPANDPAMDEFMLKSGFVKQAVPNKMIADITGNTYEKFIKSLSKNIRHHQQRKVRKWIDQFDVEIIKKGDRGITEAELKHFYNLYKNVKNRSLELNTFALPEKIYENIIKYPSWEFILLKLKPEFGGKPNGLPVAVSSCFNNGTNYCSMFIGLDYDYVLSNHSYRVSFYHIIHRAIELGLSKIFMGMTAEIEKYGFGAKPHQMCVYIQSNDHYNFDLLENIKNNLSISK